MIELDKILTPLEIEEFFPDGQIEVLIPLTLHNIALSGCGVEEYSVEGLNRLVDETILGIGGGSLMNIKFKAVEVRDDFIMVQVTADASEIIDNLEEYLTEQQRRDEKNGLYPQHEDVTN